MNQSTQTHNPEADAGAMAGRSDPVLHKQTESQTSTQGSARGLEVLRTIVRGLLALVILGGGIFAALWFNWTEGQAQTGAEEPESARLVETVTVREETAHITVRAMGTVTPAREVVLRPRVSGSIIRQHANFVPGGHFEADQFMLQIDRSDYRHTVQQRQSELEQAQATLKIERGDQAVAREELKLLGEDIPDIDRELILREPQVNQAEASVASAQAALEQAKLNLERTRIEAPFDGHIVSRSVAAGNNISQGDQLATFVGSDQYWIELAVPVSHLRWIDIPNQNSTEGSPARITNADAWGESAYRQGRVTQLIGELEQQSRMAQVIVSVPDPLARDPQRENKPPLLLGSFVDVSVQGQRLENTIAIDRAYLRDNDIVWVMNDSDRLELRPVSVVFRGKERAYLESGLQEGDQVVTTNLSAPVEGMLLRTSDESDSSDDLPAIEEQEANDE